MTSRFFISKANISLTFYVFLILGLFLLSVAGIQLLFIHQVEQKIQEEIAVKSAKLSTQVVDYVIKSKLRNAEKSLEERLAANGTVISSKRVIVKPFEKISLSPSEVKQLPADELRELLLTKTEQGSSPNNAAHSDAIRRVKEVLDMVDNPTNNIELKRAEQDVFVLYSPDLISGDKRILNIRTDKSAIGEYFNLLTLITLALSIISLLFAYWLAKHLSQPLTNLKKGFKALRKGDFSYRLRAEGVKEVRQTLSLFNQTSEQLARLHALETRFLQQQQLAELGEVSRGIAHSLRNPLNTIGLALEEMSETNLDKNAQRQIVAQARQKIIALDNTIKSLLLLTTSGISRADNVSVNDIVHDAVMQMSMGSSHAIHVSAEQALSVKGSSVELTAVLTTLLSNAIEASDAGQDIEVNVAKLEHRIVIRVVDRGQGLSPDIEQRLFQPHVTTKAEGAGMGLYIAKRIVTLHYEGDLSVVNNCTKGCTAILSLSNGNLTIHNERKR